MLRRRLTAAEHAHIEQVARAKRVSLGLEPEAPEDAEYEALRAEARESAKRRKRRKQAPVSRPETRAAAPEQPTAELNVREHIGPCRIDARVYWTMAPRRADVDLWAWEVFLSHKGRDGVHYVSECELGAERDLSESYLRLIDALTLLAARHPELGNP